ncbi:MAG: hypothetical protein K8I00_11830, partial [Candidatus Omnitrophica bacterium]|nr:hypothetical protein [Candidatus Omnitrophota bacterium]
MSELALQKLGPDKLLKAKVLEYVSPGKFNDVQGILSLYNIDMPVPVAIEIVASMKEIDMIDEEGAFQRKFDEAMTAELRDVAPYIIFDTQPQDNVDMAMLDDIVLSADNIKLIAVSAGIVGVVAYRMYARWLKTAKGTLHRINKYYDDQLLEAVYDLGYRGDASAFEPLMELLQDEKARAYKANIVRAIQMLSHPEVATVQTILDRLQKRMPTEKRNRLEYHSANFFLRAWELNKLGFDFKIVFEKEEGHTNPDAEIPEHPGYPNYYDTSTNTAAANQIDMEYEEAVNRALVAAWVVDKPEVFKLERGNRIDQAMTAQVGGEAATVTRLETAAAQEVTTLLEGKMIEQGADLG